MAIKHEEGDIMLQMYYNEMKRLTLDNLGVDYIPDMLKSVEKLKDAIEDADKVGDIVFSCMAFLVDAAMLDEYYGMDADGISLE